MHVYACMCVRVCVDMDIDIYRVDPIPRSKVLHTVQRRREGEVLLLTDEVSD